MGRQLKFRAWDKIKREMVKFPILLSSFPSTEPENVVVIINDNYDIMQYAECCDKNGKDLYDGDIVIADWHWTEPHVVELPDDYYAFTEFSLSNETIEILGNEYENPELLKGKQ